MRILLRQIASDTSGATAVEYGLILALIFIAMLTAVQNFGTATITMWNSVSSKMAEASK
ncbi:Flp family type IVb pilin [Altererythrobacter aerius]|uniref:Flp family type IVb pilin n=1 Tax=Tsuneonella aeria TaxID=1837929 RepID=A0A6I4TAL4_9SPHN|nr:Flp family type IVb pilin [Tsuneonella aeria]MXO73707.1 Flp family type IVb pilin [Tsuneonella aeria]